MDSQPMHLIETYSAQQDGSVIVSDQIVADKSQWDPPTETIPKSVLEIHPPATLMPNIELPDPINDLQAIKTEDKKDSGERFEEVCITRYQMEPHTYDEYIVDIQEKNKMMKDKGYFIRKFKDAEGDDQAITDILAIQDKFQQEINLKKHKEDEQKEVGKLLNNEFLKNAGKQQEFSQKISNDPDEGLFMSQVAELKEKDQAEKISIIENKLLPYIDADHTPFTWKESKQMFKHFQQFKSKKINAASINGGSKIVVSGENQYEVLEVSKNSVRKTDQVKINLPYNDLQSYAFSKSGRYFIQMKQSGFAIVDLQNFTNFFKPDFKLADQQKLTYVELAKESIRADGTDVLQQADIYQYILQGQLFSSSEHIFFLATVPEQKNYYVLKTIEPASKFYEQIQANQHRYVFQINKSKLFQRFGFESVNLEAEIDSFKVQEGADYIYFFQNKLLTQVFNIKTELTYPVELPKFVMDEDCGYDEDEFSQFFIDAQESLWIKYYDDIIQYSVGKYTNEYSDEEEEVTGYCEVAKIRLEENHPALDHGILKVFEKHIYFLNNDKDNLIVLDFKNKSIIYNLSVKDAVNSSLQSNIHPFILSSYGAYNIFFPQPLASLHSKKSSKIISSGIGIDTTKSILLSYKKQKGLKSIVKLKGELNAKKISKESLIDYIPEYNIFLHWAINNKTQKNEVFVTQLNHQELISVKIADDDQLILDATTFIKRVVNKISKDGVLEGITINIILKSEKINNDKEALFAFNYLIISIPTQDISKSSLTIIDKQSNVLSPDVSQAYYCAFRNELLLSVEFKKDSQDVKQCILYQMTAQKGMIMVKEKQEFQHIANIFLFNERMIYVNDSSTDSFQIVKLGLVDNKIHLSTISRYPTLKNVKRVLKIRMCVLVQMNNDEIYLSNPQGTAISAMLKNSIEGTLVQDRNNINDLYYFKSSANNKKKRKTLMSTYVLNFFNNSGNTIPHQLLIRESLFSEYDHKTHTISYKSSIDSVGRLFYLKLRSQSDANLDFQHLKTYVYDHSPNLENSQVSLLMSGSRKILKRDFDFTDGQTLRKVRELSIQNAMSYSTIQRTGFLHSAIKYEKNHILKQFIDQLQKTKFSEIPFLFPEFSRRDEIITAFDLALRTQSLRPHFQDLFDLMVNCDPKGMLYKDVLYRNLNFYEMYKINLKKFFNSSMPIYENSNFDKFAQYHADDASLFIPFNLNSDLKNVKDMYLDFIQKALDENELEQSMLSQMVNGVQRRFGCCKKIQNKNEKEKQQETNCEIVQRQIDDPTQINPRTNRNSEIDTEELFEIEYNVVNMPELIQENPTRFMKMIQGFSDQDITFLDIPVIQMVINFKWKQYTEGYFMRQFYKTMLFLISFITDIIIIGPDGLDSEKKEYFITCLVSRIICGLVIFDHTVYEARQVKKIYSDAGSISKTLDSYFLKDFWNVFDLTIFILYYSYLPIIYLYEPDSYQVKIIQCAIIMQFSVKFNFFLRLFERFGFLVQMIVNVFFDLRYFLTYFAIIISFFAIMVSIIVSNVEEHDGIGQFMYFIMVLRTSLGDNDIDQQFSDFKILFWIIWVVIVVVGNIVLMNFIIAVVSESYEACMAKRVASTYRVKVDMIVERENLMSKDVFLNNAYFPQYIFVRQPRDSDKSEEVEQLHRRDQMDQHIKQISDSVEQLKLDIHPESINKDVKEAIKTATKEAKQIDEVLTDLKKATKNLAKLTKGELVDVTAFVR